MHGHCANLYLTFLNNHRVGGGVRMRTEKDCAEGRERVVGKEEGGREPWGGGRRQHIYSRTRRADQGQLGRHGPSQQLRNYA